MAKTGAASYRQAIRAAARGLWVGALDYYQAYDSLITTIENRIPQAWYEGAAACAVSPSELSPEERRQMQLAKMNEVNHIDDLLTWVEQNSKAEGGKLGVVGGTGGIMARIELWASRYKDIVNRAKVMACGDRKLMWRLGPTKVHCKSCLRLDGKVKRASYWQKIEVRPRHPPNSNLECEGWICLCVFELTNEPMSKGPLPKLP